MTYYRRSHNVSPADTYLTPPWAIQFLLEHWQPKGDVICDPCACGFNGYSVGSTVANATARGLELYDLNPQHPDVKQSDFRELVLPERSRTIITNPPFNLSTPFVQWGLQYADEVVVLVRSDWFANSKQDRSKHLVKFVMPTCRMNFWILPDHAPHVPTARQSAASVTGWTMPDAPTPNGWAVFHRGYTGPAELVIAKANRKFNPFQK